MNLTKEQLAAVQSEARETLVISGAGAGKTAVIVARVQYLIEQRGASQSDIMLLSFTRKSAGEMLERLKVALGDEHPIKGMLIGTFHSVALQILRSEGHRLGYDPESLTILDAADADTLLEEAAKELGYAKPGKGKLTWSAGLSFDRVSKFRESQYTGQELKDAWAKDPALFKIFRAYQYKMREFNTMDFGTILDQCRRLLREHADVLQRYRDRIKHVLVDELQDSDATQYDLHDFFAPPATFFGVGDTRQSIYGFRGARPDFMVERHPHAHTVPLTLCFRCGSDIVAAANTLIARNKEPLAEPMVADESTGKGRVEVFHGRSEDVLIEAGKCMQHGFAPSDIAILARNHRTLRRLEEVANEKGIPAYRVGARFDVCETDEFRNSHAVYRLAVNPKDQVAKWRLRSKAALDVSYPDNSFGETLVKNASFPGDWPKARAFWDRNCGTMTIKDALRWYAMLGTQQHQRLDSGEDRPEGGAIALMTVHAAKGLEFPVVIVANCMDGEFPASRALKEHLGEREERRLFYVAATRAKERLLLHYRTADDQSEDRQVSEPSRFIKEAGLINPELIVAT